MELGMGQSISWALLKEEFNSHFISKVVQEAMARYFMDLVQGGITVIDYATRFTQLSQFYVYLILDEEKKAEKFERGLNP
jgi:hypothetical protein